MKKNVRTGRTGFRLGAQRRIVIKTVQKKDIPRMDRMDVFKGSFLVCKGVFVVPTQTKSVAQHRFPYELDRRSDAKGTVRGCWGSVRRRNLPLGNRTRKGREGGKRRLWAPSQVYPGCDVMRQQHS